MSVKTKARLVNPESVTISIEIMRALEKYFAEALQG